MAEESVKSGQGASVVSVTGLGLSYGTQVLFDGANLAVHEGDRIGLVGRNGCGKSTFLKVIAGALEADEGTVARRNHLVIGYLPQQFELEDDLSVEENVRNGAAYVLGLIQEFENGGVSEARAEELQHEIEHFDGWNVESRIRMITAHLNAPALDARVGDLSGGEKRRVAFAKALVAKPDFLVLDEPTNHLDTETILWLEGFLMRYAGAVLFVTHDRYFLDRVANRVVELSDGSFYSHSGTYADYLEAKALRQQVAENTEKKRQSFLRRELAWVKRGAKARTTKAKARLDRFEEVSNVEAWEGEMDMELVIPPAPKLANRIIEVEGVSKAYGEKRLFEGFDLNLSARDRIGIVGKNGLGKTSLLKILLKLLDPDEGNVRHGTRTEINYVDQTRLLLDENKTILEEVGGTADHISLGEEKIHVRTYLHRFLFSDERINMTIRHLSGGEKSRILLAKILKNGGNVLVLDEPTNDLDLATLRVLEEALLAFKGVVLAVSHDRYFLNRICTGIIAFEGDGVVDFHVGNYDDYLERRTLKANKAKESSDIAEKSKGGGVSGGSKQEKGKEKPRKLKWKEEEELAGMEETLLKAEEKAEELEGIFQAPDFYEKYGDRWQEVEKDLEEAKREVKRLYERWDELEQVREAYEAWRA